MILKVIVAVEFPSAEAAAIGVQRRLQGRDKRRTVAVLQVQDLSGRVRWSAPKEPRKT